MRRPPAPPAPPFVTRPSRRAACVAAAALWLPVRGRAGGQTLVAGPGERLRSLASAVQAARDGDTIELQPGDYPGDVAVIEQHGLTLRGLGAGAVLHAEGRQAEGKAIVVVRGEATLQNLEFRGCRVPHGNGAGVRFERGRLRVQRCRFFDNEMGLLTANLAGMALEVLDCHFGAAPRHAGPLHHLLYVGAIDSLHVQGSRFEQGWRGHLLKCRARSSVVLGNWLVDGPQGEASYELEFAEGGEHLVAGNVIAQGPRSQNPVIVSLGAEASAERRGRLRLVHNTLVNHGSGEARFVRLWSERLSADSGLWAINNLFAGAGRPELPAGADAGGNVSVELEALAAAASADYRLAADSAQRTAALPADLPALAAFTVPLGSRPWPAAARLPGALQPD